MSWSVRVPDLRCNRINNKTQNGRHISKGKMHRIMIGPGPFGKLSSTKWGFQFSGFRKSLFFSI